MLQITIALIYRAQSFDSQTGLWPIPWSETNVDFTGSTTSPY